MRNKDVIIVILVVEIVNLIINMRRDDKINEIERLAERAMIVARDAYSTTTLVKHEHKKEPVDED